MKPTYHNPKEAGSSYKTKEEAKKPKVPKKEKKKAD